VIVLRRHHLVATPLVTAVLALGGCGPNPRDTQILAKILSPDGKLEAIYAVDAGGGAAVGTTEEVFVVQPGAFPRLDERVFSEECAHDISLTWEAPRTLKVSYQMGSDIQDDAEEHKRSFLSVLSSGYWTYPHPHGTQIQFARAVTPAGHGC